MSKAVEIIDGVLFVHTRHYDDVNRVIICHQKKPFRVFSDDAKKEPSRPHGEWNDHDICSCCGMMTEYKTQYCGGCGAYMKNGYPYCGY